MAIHVLSFSYYSVYFSGKTDRKCGNIIFWYKFQYVIPDSGYAAIVGNTETYS